MSRRNIGDEIIQGMTEAIQFIKVSNLNNEETKMPEVNKTKKEFKKVIVEGIAMYASVHKPKKPYNEGDIPAYTLDLIVTDEEAAKLTAEGLKVSKVKIDEDTKKPKEYATHPGMKVFQFRRKTMKFDGTPNSPLQVVDSQNNTIPGTTNVGNGSKIRVSVNPYKNNFGTTSHTLLGVQVLELVEYKSANTGSSFEPVKGGFVADSKPDTEASDSDPFKGTF